MPNVKLSHVEIEELLDAIIIKIFDTKKDLIEHGSKIKKFYQTLFFEVLGSNDTYQNLGKYLDVHHQETFLQTLTTCLSSESQV